MYARTRELFQKALWLDIFADTTNKVLAISALALAVASGAATWALALSAVPGLLLGIRVLFWLLRSTQDPVLEIGELSLPVQSIHSAALGQALREDDIHGGDPDIIDAIAAVNAQAFRESVSYLTFEHHRQVGAMWASRDPRSLLALALSGADPRDPRNIVATGAVYALNARGRKRYLEDGVRPFLLSVNDLADWQHPEACECLVVQTLVRNRELSGPEFTAEALSLLVHQVCLFLSCMDPWPVIVTETISEKMTKRARDKGFSHPTEVKRGSNLHTILRLDPSAPDDPDDPDNMAGRQMLAVLREIIRRRAPELARLHARLTGQTSRPIVRSPRDLRSDGAAGVLPISPAG